MAIATVPSNIIVMDKIPVKASGGANTNEGFQIIAYGKTKAISDILKAYMAVVKYLPPARVDATSDASATGGVVFEKMAKKEQKA